MLEGRRREVKKRLGVVLWLREGGLVGRKRRPFYNTFFPRSNREFGVTFIL
jgi:hypothetical protein